MHANFCSQQCPMHISAYLILIIVSSVCYVIETFMDVSFILLVDLLETHFVRIPYGKSSR